MDSTDEMNAWPSGIHGDGYIRYVIKVLREIFLNRQSKDQKKYETTI